MLWFVGQFLDYKKVLKCRIKRPKILELGSGSGILSHILIDRYGGSATLIDASREAIDFAKEVSRRNHEIEYINKDIFSIHPKPEFDIVHSQGLFEHFREQRQIDLFKRHIQFAKPGGYVLVSVPRVCCLNSVVRKILQFLNHGRLPFGYEKHMEVSELSSFFLREGLEIVTRFEGLLNLVMLGRKN